MARAHAIETPPDDVEPEYREGLRLAIEAAVHHTIAAGSGGEAPVPLAILSQARLAARREVPIGTVLRRYQAGHAVLGDFVIEEAEHCSVSSRTLGKVLRWQALRTDGVMAAISHSYVQETQSTPAASTRSRQAERVHRLLNGELIDPAAIDYDFDRWHVSIAVHGPERRLVANRLVGDIDARRLFVSSADEVLHVWIGTRAKMETQRLGTPDPPWMQGAFSIGVSEPCFGRPGWRLAYDQARAALSVATRSPERIARYADVALVASAMRDEVLATSLRRLYLTPLEGGRDGGTALFNTLRTYLDSGQSVTSTAAALGVSRNTVTNRLRTIEEKIRGVSAARAADLTVVLQLRDLLPVTECTGSAAES